MHYSVVLSTALLSFPYLISDAAMHSSHFGIFGDSPLAAGQSRNWSLNHRLSAASKSCSSHMISASTNVSLWTTINTTRHVFPLKRQFTMQTSTIVAATCTGFHIYPVLARGFNAQLSSSSSNIDRSSNFFFSSGGIKLSIINILQTEHIKINTNYIQSIG